MLQQPKILISGGGTGGHIFPAIAIADALKQKVPGAELLFVGALGRMEMQKVPEAGYAIEGLWISGFQRNLSWRNLSFPFKLVSSLCKAAAIIRRFRPDVVVGVGGYASGPTLKMAARKGIPTVLQEQNSLPGVTNRLLAKKAAKICVAYPGMEKYFPAAKIILTGNPIRSKVISIEGKRAEALEFFALDAKKKTILVVGGSQGARSVNVAVAENLKTLAAENIQMIWQTGLLQAEWAQQMIDEHLSEEERGHFKVHAFINRMELAYAAADVVISRAGAIAISELSAVAKPCIFIPLPSAAEDHQTKNAVSLEQRQAAIHLPDAKAVEALGKIAVALIGDRERQQTLSVNIKKNAVEDSAGRIADEILKLVQKKSDV
ncbi:MAG: undecaprenyldiphospho-muramoylpentapeptide beta-N-acetylglucosaminyltransferase [Bacteroidales bacterium]|jgi:UDP-N-acetylglucosamine--N-acetylmuramyl-(pentapeptide) pyrophosphoryl-undecaprenol N-acetylglucosamine transferase|nr:undecaprenyldiphospho-muramoylpentapeptide beta-N-acetylglucosaminyltransferase [Bacteroidales bacterium]NCU34898.1 undecaprenyldiphospho-muramoylpentapeptide beta-N-acetylglucosaminyltransferase [Candidatus Falkowbacteria bacterium]MDD2632260.1 undecaprenyldiphospho-muramoylpentapeptide beta-N-acetylglucosaminyltransferase [Bacteroidales bacterium]MDD3130871.1 undecaprenyldiphospho-muramoylpentapeptide beta-N-acetylglucosaminyltransferase [Bacteroidales bacterium]MDD3525884.1 undecaprenyldi